MRKTPKQARSRQMVERIVTAGRTVLVDDGYDAFSTNRVATAAGVSPGSVYQYFPDKAAILSMIVDRYWDDVAERVVASLGDRVGSLTPGAVRAVVDALLVALESDPALLRVVYEDLPVRDLRDRRGALERRVRDLTAAVLAIGPGGPPRAPASAAWLIVLAMESLAVRWVLDQPDLTRDDLLDECVALVTGYLDARSRLSRGTS